MSVPLWFDWFDENCVLAVVLAENLEDIVPRQGPESKAPLAVSGLLAHRGFANFIHDFFEGETVLGVRKIIVSRQSRANRIIRALRGENAGVGVFFLLFLLLKFGHGGGQALLLLSRPFIGGDVRRR